MGKRAGELVKAVAYLRTSSATNIGADRDSDKRQCDAIAGFANHAGFVIVDEFYDAAVSGADHIDQRPGLVIVPVIAGQLRKGPRQRKAPPVECSRGFGGGCAIIG